MKSLPLCDGGKCPCGRRVTKARNRFFEQKCAQRASKAPDTQAMIDKVDVKGDKCEITKMVQERVRTLADLIRVCEIDTNEWDIERWLANKWEQAAMQEAVVGKVKVRTEPIVTELYQIKVWLRRKPGLVAARQEIEALKAEAKKAAVARPSLLKSKNPTGNMLEISIYDLHVGKLAWKGETGWHNYDSKIAESRFFAALEALIQRTAAFTFEKILFTVGNDLLNADNVENTTTAGTPQDTDSRYHKSFRLARRMMTAAIERLRSIAPVHVVIVPGNHDSNSAWHLGDSLECLFHKTEDVTIENEPTPRKYYRFGKVLLMFTHGDEGKRLDYPLLMATERKEDFGQTEFCEIHTGHHHKIQLEETHGIRVRIIPALCAADSWHAKKGYVGNLQAAEAFVWNKDEGLINQAHYTVRKAEAEAA